MKDYLWDKKGDDPEVRVLEESLKEFRCPRRDPGVGNDVEKEERTPFWKILGIGMVPAFGLGLLVLAWVTVPLLDTAEYTQNDVSQIELPTKNIPPKEPVLTIIPEKIEPARKLQPSNDPIVKKVRKRKLRTYKRKRFVRKKRKKNIEAERITAEEKEAYDQLMRALAITSSNLQLVREKVEGRESSGPDDSKE